MTPHSRGPWARERDPPSLPVSRGRGFDLGQVVNRARWRARAQYEAGNTTRPPAGSGPAGQAAELTVSEAGRP